MKFIKPFLYKESQETKHKSIDFTKSFFSLDSAKTDSVSINLTNVLFYKKLEKTNHDSLNLTKDKVYKELTKPNLEIKDLRISPEKAHYTSLIEKKDKQWSLIHSKHYPSSLREWENSIFTYNTRNLDLIPSTTNRATAMIRNFFNFFNKSLEKKIRTKRLLFRLKRLTSHKIYLSKAEFSHTNNKVLINLYLFNRQKHNYISKLKNIYLRNICATNKDNTRKLNFLSTLKSIYLKGLNNLKQVNKHKYSLIKALNIIDKNDDYKISTFKSLSLYTLYFYKKLFKLSARKLRMYFLYRQLVYLNRSKLNYTYLRFLKKHLENLYNKNVEFNFINLKRFYLNSDILSEAVKLKLTRNKRKMRKILNKLKNKVKIYKKKVFLGFSSTKKNEFIVKTMKNQNLEAFVFNSLKYKHVTGFRLQAKGRLSRRFTASRSVSKFKYKGNLLDLDSSSRGLSSVILKGNLESNLQYTKLRSKTRIGSFGIKGWVSGN